MGSGSLGNKSGSCCPGRSPGAPVHAVRGADGDHPSFHETPESRGEIRRSDLRQRAADGVQADLSIRGSSFGQTLVLLNGQRMNDAQSGHHDMDIPVPLEAVSRVEVLRGSGSTMYGSDAVAGAVNIITTPPEGTEIQLRTTFGNFGANQQNVSLAGSAGRVSEQLVAARDFSSGFMPDRDYRNLQLTSTTHFATGLGSGDVTLGYMDHPFGADQFYGNFNSWENTKTWLAAWRQELGKKTTARS